MKRTQIELQELASLGSGPVMEDALRVIRGVLEATAEPDARRVTVLHDEEVTGEELVQAVRSTGVAAEVVSTTRAEETS